VPSAPVPTKASSLKDHYPTLRAALEALGVPRGTPLTDDVLNGRVIKYGKTRKRLKKGNKNRA
jgi:hypothetical protein